MRSAAVMALAVALAVAPWDAVQAQDDEEFEEDTESGDDEPESGDDEGEGDESDDEDDEGEGEDGDDAEAAEGEPAEGSDAAGAAARSWFFGPYLRYTFVPAFMLQLFLDEAPTIGNAAFGATATYRTDDGPAFEIGIGYTSYSFADPFRATGDPVEDTEYLDSDLGMVHLTGSILWDTSLVDDKLFFEYGLGLDLGILVGDIVRTEAYYNDGTNQYEPCNGPANPLAQIAYCEPPMNLGTDAYDQDGAHYGVVEERVPPFAAVPMLPRLGLRWEPLPSELAIKLEAAYGIAQIWLGLSAAYAPEI